MLIALLACTEPLPPETPSILLGPTDPTTAEDLIATVIDPVTDPNGDDVTLVWRWFRDQIEVPEANSKVLPADLTARGESWMVRVYASDGDLDSDSATASVTVVNTVPAVSLELPSEAFSSEDLVAVATVEDPDNDDLDLSWEWTVDSAPSSVIGASVDADQTQRGEVWTVSLTASDGEADDTATATVSVVNAPPEVTELTLSPEEPRTGDGLEATLATIDADGDPVTVTWSWTLDGVVLEDEEGDTLEGDYTKGQAVAVHALPTDGEDEGDLATAEVVIANTPPTVAAANLDPNDVYETSTVSCVGVSWSDPDNDPEGYTVVWRVNNTQITTAETIDGASFDKEDELTCELTPHDGDEPGEPVQVSRWVNNTPPELTSATLSMTSPQEADVLTVSVSSTDDDNDTVSYAYAWMVQGSWASNASTLSGGFFDKGDAIYVTVKASDGSGTSTLTSDVATAINTEPVASSVTLPSTVTTDQLLTATASATDADDDTLTWSYAWYVEGTLETTTSNRRLDGSTWFDKDETVYVIATPSDDESTGNAVTSSTITIVNTPPPAPEVSLSGKLVDAADDLVCSWSQDEPDADGDTLTYSIDWDVDGTAFTDTTTTTTSGDTVAAADTKHGEAWTCTVTPDDGEEEGDAGELSALVTSDCDPVTALTMGSDYGHLGGTGMMDRSEGTLEAWIYPSDSGTLFSMRGSAGTLELKLSSTGALEQRVVTQNSCSNHSKTTTNVVDWDAWNHIAWTADGFGVANRVCIDGVCEAFSGTGMGVWGSCLGNENFYIGATYSSTPSNYFDGAMEDLRVWTDSRTTTELQDSMFLKYDDLSGASGLMAWYSFDGGSTTLEDELGSYDGTWTGSSSDFEDYDWCD